MKGIMIYSNPMWGDNERATFCEFINEASFDSKTIAKDLIGQSGHYIWKVGEHKKIVSRLEGEVSEKSKAVCSKNDAYDFETGALVALMKMCGLEKSAKAYAEIFDDTAYGDALKERDKLKRLLCYAKEDINMKIGYLKEKDEEIEQLKEKNNGLYNLARKYVDEIDQKDHEIISLKALKITNESLKKDNESFRKTCEKLKEENSCLKNEMLLLMDKNNELIEKKKDLKKKLNAMYGYVDTDNVKPELPRTLDINGVTYRKGVSLKDFSKAVKIEHGPFITGRDYEEDFISQMDKILSICKPLTKREQMWQKIKTYKGSSCIEVDRANVIDFLEDLENEMPNILWPTGDKPTSTKPMFNYKYLADYNKMYFFIGGDYMTYSHDKETSRTNVQYITYLPPMRWDLFKKGRLVVRCKNNEVDEFKTAFENSEGPWYNFEKPLRREGTCFYRYNKSTYWVEIIHQLRPGENIFDDAGKLNGRKIVHWEDVK